MGRLCTTVRLSGRVGAPLMLTVALLAALGGCNSINPELGPASPSGPSVSLDTLAPTEFAARAKDRNAKKPDDAAGPSVVSVTRENWRPVTFRVPASGVQHHPIYTDDKPRFARETARARGEYPTQVSSLETTSEDSSGSLALEGLAAPVRAGLDIIRMPVLAFQRAPWAVEQSPIDVQPYQRGPGLLRKESITGSALPAATTSAPKATSAGDVIDKVPEAVGASKDELKKVPMPEGKKP